MHAGPGGDSTKELLEQKVPAKGMFTSVREYESFLEHWSSVEPGHSMHIRYMCVARGAGA